MTRSSEISTESEDGSNAETESKLLTPSEEKTLAERFPNGGGHGGGLEHREPGQRLLSPDIIPVRGHLSEEELDAIHEEYPQFNFNNLDGAFSNRSEE